MSRKKVERRRARMLGALTALVVAVGAVVSGFVGSTDTTVTVIVDVGTRP